MIFDDFREEIQTNYTTICQDFAPKTGRAAAILAQKMVPFDLPTGLFEAVLDEHDLLLGTCKGIESGAIQLPFEHTAFLARGIEVSSQNAKVDLLFQVSQTEDKFIYAIFGRVGNRWFCISTREMLRATTQTRGIVPMFADNPALSEQQGKHMDSNLLAFMTILDLEKTVIERVDPSDRLNKARVKNGKQPLMPYHVCKIKLTRGDNGPRYSQTGRASPLAHARRGHTRHLPTKNVWVKPTMVGADQLVVDKRYVVEA